jgi:hypothetical protein
MSEHGTQVCPHSRIMGDCWECEPANSDGENAVLLHRLDHWQPGDLNTTWLIRWAAAHLRGEQGLAGKMADALAGAVDGSGMYLQGYTAAKAEAKEETDRLRDALQKIAGMDYRGARSLEQTIAYNALNHQEPRKTASVQEDRFGHGGTITWDTFMAAYAVFVKRHGSSESPEKMAWRGFFTHIQLDDLLGEGNWSYIGYCPATRELAGWSLRCGQPAGHDSEFHIDPTTWLWWYEAPEVDRLADKR